MWVWWLALAGAETPSGAGDDASVEGVDPPGRSLLTQALVSAFGQDRMRADSAEALARIDEACALGQRVGCEVERWWSLRDTGLPDLEVAAGALRPQCERQDDAVACLVAAWHMGQTQPGQYDAAAEAPDDAAALLTKACDAQLLRACVDLAAMEQLGLVAEAGPTEAAERLTKACDAGSLAGCRRLAAAHLSGVGVERDPSRARDLLERTCDAGYAIGCNGLALVSHLGFAVAKDEELAVSLYRQSCEDGFVPACSNVVPLYDAGLIGVAEPRRLELLTQGCAEGHGVACAHVGEHWYAATPPDLLAAAGAWAQACEQGHPGGCGGLGLLMSTGAGVPLDVVGAVPLLEGSCEAGQHRACTGLGQLQLDGEGVTRNREQAFERFQAACDADHGPACAAAAEQLRRGRGVDRDRELAGQLKMRACGLGVAESCE